MKRLVIILITGIVLMFSLYLMDTFSKVSQLSSQDLKINFNLTNNAQEISHYYKGNAFKFLVANSSNEKLGTAVTSIKGVPNLKLTSDISADVSKVEYTLRKNRVYLTMSSNFQDINKYLQNNRDDNSYEIEIELHYNFRFVEGVYKEKYQFDIDYPVEFSLDQTSVNKGDFITVRTLNKSDDDIIEVSSTLKKHSFDFYEDGDELVGFLPIDYREDLGLHCLVINTKCNEFEITHKEFKEVHFNIDYTTLKKTTSTNAYEQYNREISRAIAQNKDDIMYESKFIMPTNGRLSSDFLDTRYINGSKTPSSYHTGIDIANQEGTEIYATASGKVVLAMDLIVSGNSVIIHHGGNLFSIYYHMNELIAKEGQFVIQGEIIGLMGSTGMSTGSHLHFGMRIGSSYINPWHFVKGDQEGKVYE